MNALKKIRNTSLAVALFGISLLIHCTQVAVAQNNKPGSISNQQQVEDVVSRLEGTMDTSAQARTNPKVANVRMTTCRIGISENNSPSTNKSIFLYQEQAFSPEFNKPHRQSFLEISSVNSGRTVGSLSYKPVNAKAAINLCNKPASERMVKFNDIGEPFCSVFLTRSQENYIGITPSQGCPANVPEAVKITNTIVLGNTSMKTWERGFDSKSKQVWGDESNGYEFRKIVQ
jgi:CpeT/CpcT family (DUF1001)